MKADAWHPQTAGAGSAGSVTKRLLELPDFFQPSTQSNRPRSRVAAHGYAAANPRRYGLRCLPHEL